MNLKKTEGKKKKEEAKPLKLLYNDLVDNDKVVAQRGELVYLTDGLWITPEGEVIDLGR